jgi:hypothetical protein
VTSPAGSGATDARPALRLLGGLRRALVFLISDMLFDPPLWHAETVRLLGGAAARHEVVALTVRDPAEQPRSRLWHEGGVLECRDPETGRVRLLDVSHGRLERALADRDRRISEALRSVGVDHVRLLTHEDPVVVLRRYFRRVQLRRRFGT